MVAAVFVFVVQVPQSVLVDIEELYHWFSVADLISPLLHNDYYYSLFELLAVKHWQVRTINFVEEYSVR